MFVRRFCTLNSVLNNEAGQYIYNRNPRNLEKLCIAYKPDGYFLDKPGHRYWHKVTVSKSSKHITASVEHHTGAVAVSASTKEWAIKKHLYSTSDISAYVNLGRVLGKRCLQMGITELTCFLKPLPGSKLQALLTQLSDSGVSLSEPPRYIHPRPSDKDRPEKPWEVHV